VELLCAEASGIASIVRYSKRRWYAKFPERDMSLCLTPEWDPEFPSRSELLSKSTGPDAGASAQGGRQPNGGCQSLLRGLTSQFKEAYVSSLSGNSDACNKRQNAWVPSYGRIKPRELRIGYADWRATSATDSPGTRLWGNSLFWWLRIFTSPGAAFARNDQH